MDAALFVALALSFATFVTAHLALAVGLTMRAPHWRGALGLLVPPLAPYWGLRAGFRYRSVIWLASAIAYSATMTLGALLE